MLKIGINALYIKWGVNAGTETYFTNIVKPWYEESSANHHITLYCNQLPPWWEGEKPHFTVKVYTFGASLYGRLYLEQILFPLALPEKIDVLFSPGYVGSIFLRIKQIVTIHDGFAWRYPAEIGWLRGRYWRIAIPWSARKATRVIAVSKNTARDVVKYCGVPRSKISVVLEAGGQLKKIKSEKGILKKLALCPRKYFHCVGFFKNIKNPYRILEAYQRYVSVTQSKACKKLVLVGHIGGKKNLDILEATHKIPNVIVAGRLNDSELSSIYQHSSGLIFPSLYEGFGIPILEAQSFGCPVITSNSSSMPEVAGNGAILVDPFNIEEISKAMLQLCENDLQNLIERGRMNLKHFSWEKASHETLILIRELVSKEVA